MSHIEQSQIVRAIVAEVLEVDPELVQGDTNFVLDLDADSLRIIEILSRLESALGLTIDQAQLARMISLNSVLDVLADSVVATA
ncbi:MAG: acyl carrier protein [Rubrivivax sp.]|nr:acyl carrier protein [Rubrivivax sp.]